MFLLSEAEAYGSGGVSHGFTSGYGTYDEARRCKATDYARAMSAWRSTNDGYEGNMDVGTATVTVSGGGDFTGSATATFKIPPRACSVPR